ncbi:MAG: hypothetical protein AB1689_15940 [Thermodesulfobacteriota bacterium]
MWFPIIPVPSGAPIPLPITYDLASFLPVSPLVFVPIGFALLLLGILAAARGAKRRHEATAAAAARGRGVPPEVPHAA